MSISTDLAVDTVSLAAPGVQRVEPLTREQAIEITEHIRNTSDVLWVLISRAHAGRAWEAMGYPTWEAYVRDEFHISRSRAYQLLDMAKIIQSIEAVLPEGTEPPRITEKAARDLKRVLAEVVPEVEQATAGLGPADASAVVDDILRKYRQGPAGSVTFDEQTVPVEHADDYGADGGPRYPDDPHGSGDVGGGLGSSYLDDEFAAFVGPDVVDVLDADEVVDAGGGAPAGGGAGPSAGEGGAPAKRTGPDPAQADAALLRRTVQSIYDLYAALAGLKSMGSAADIAAAIPPERRAHVSENLPLALTWLQDFAEVWQTQPWQEITDDTAA